MPSPNDAERRNYNDLTDKEVADQLDTISACELRGRPVAQRLLTDAATIIRTNPSLHKSVKDCNSGTRMDASTASLVQRFREGWAATHDLVRAADEIERLHALRSTTAPNARAGAWMVERQIDGRSAWWTGAHADHFDHDPNQGIRFSRQQDAFWIARKNVNQPFTITEHVWLDDAATLPVSESVPIPEGWKLVPVEPTPEMVKAAAHCTDDEQCSYRHEVYTKTGSIKCHACHDEFVDAYKDMLAAAPSPNKEDDR